MNSNDLGICLRIRRITYSLVILASIFMSSNGYGQKNLNFENLSFRTKLKYQDKYNKNSAKMYVRMQKDSLIWMQVSANIGIRGLRALVTKDSAFVIDYVNKEYAKYDFASLSKELNFPVNFDLLQSILLGTMPYPNYDASKVIKKKDKKYWIVHQRESFLNIENHFNPKIERLLQMILTDTRNHNKLFLEYDKYKKVKSVTVPTQQNVKIKYEDGGEIMETYVELKHKKPKINQESLAFPFKISSRYKLKVSRK